MTNKETPASIYLRLYGEFKHMMKYGWSARSTERIDDMCACIAELADNVSEIRMREHDLTYRR